MMKTEDYVIDSYAWIEYFKGSKKGQIVLPYIEGGHGLTPLVVIAELSAFYARIGQALWEQNLRFIEARTSLLELNLEVAKKAGPTRQRMRQDRPKFGLIDAMIYETALSLKASVVSGDPHFEGLPHVVFLGEFGIPPS